MVKLMNLTPDQFRLVLSKQNKKRFDVTHMNAGIRRDCDPYIVIVEGEDATIQKLRELMLDSDYPGQVRYAEMGAKA